MQRLSLMLWLQTVHLQDRIKIPRDFFRKWGKKLHKKVIIDDGCGNFSSADIVVENHKAKKAAFFVNGVKDIVQIYYKHGSCLVYSQRQNSAKGPSTTHPLPGPLKGATTIIGWEKLMTYAIVNSSQALHIPADRRNEEFYPHPRKVEVFLPDGTLTH
ncbi:hypothetical protein GLYMA_01G202750v4 [Glycine max]|nr:hypothetical protein GLYMA_01G202750v4 [Glycine max]KAH1164034.1 hypothetical protein GYH30_002197 [Glycine max]